MESFFGLLAPSLYEVTFLCISSGKSQNIFLSLHGSLLSVLPVQTELSIIYIIYVLPVLIPLGLPVAFWMQLRGGPCGPASLFSIPSAASHEHLWAHEAAPPSHLVLAVS